MSEKLTHSICLWTGALLVFAVSANRASAQVTDGPPTANAVLASIQAHPDVTVELVAAEPLVQDPVAMQFDERGRLWVVEMGDYPGRPPVDSEESSAPGPSAVQRASSRIRLLRDRDGDGRYETSHLFADGLQFATGVQPWRDGVIVTLSGEIVFLADTNGDHTADLRETWLDGFAQQNPQLRANDPTFALDGWVYIATGLRGGAVRSVHPRFIAANGSEPISISRSGFRFHPDSGLAEAIAGESQYGIAFDAWGNRFVCDNRHPLQHVVLERRYLPLLAPLGWTRTTCDVLPAGEESRLFSIGRQGND